MIINFHPSEIPSQSCIKIIAELVEQNPSETVIMPNDKTSQEWQNIIKSDESITMIAPTYWWGIGYEFDKWLQSVFAYNFAFSYDTGAKVGLLDGREFNITLTHGTPEIYAGEMKQNITDRLQKGIFGYCDAKINVNFVDTSKK